MKYITKNAEETIRVGNDFADILQIGDFVALYGDLGAGKTAFVSGIVSKSIPEAYVHSPTYALVNVYEGTNYNINHFDMYRINDEDDLYSIGFYDYFNGDINIVEWCEKIPFALPDEYYKITINKIDESLREINIEKVINNENTGT